MIDADAGAGVCPMEVVFAPSLVYAAVFLFLDARATLGGDGGLRRENGSAGSPWGKKSDDRLHFDRDV